MARRSADTAIYGTLVEILEPGGNGRDWRGLLQDSKGNRHIVTSPEALPGKIGDEIAAKGRYAPGADSSLPGELRLRRKRESDRLKALLSGAGEAISFGPDLPPEARPILAVLEEAAGLAVSASVAKGAVTVIAAAESHPDPAYAWLGRLRAGLGLKGFIHIAEPLAFRSRDARVLPASFGRTRLTPSRPGAKDRVLFRAAPALPYARPSSVIVPESLYAGGARFAAEMSSLPQAQFLPQSAVGGETRRLYTLSRLLAEAALNETQGPLPQDAGIVARSRREGAKAAFALLATAQRQNSLCCLDKIARAHAARPVLGDLVKSCPEGGSFYAPVLDAAYEGARQLLESGELAKADAAALMRVSLALAETYGLDEDGFDALLEARKTLYAGHPGISCATGERVLDASGGVSAWQAAKLGMAAKGFTFGTGESLMKQAVEAVEEGCFTPEQSVGGTRRALAVWRADLDALLAERGTGAAARRHILLGEALSLAGRAGPYAAAAGPELRVLLRDAARRADAPGTPAAPGAALTLLRPEGDADLAKAFTEKPENRARAYRIAKVLEAFNLMPDKAAAAELPGLRAKANAARRRLMAAGFALRCDKAAWAKAASELPAEDQAEISAVAGRLPAPAKPEEFTGVLPVPGWKPKRP
jgi:hypothetical protein